MPGITSTALELWQGRSCARREFRSRYWASTNTVRKAVIDPLCLLEHLVLNASTKSDPEGVRLRAADGFSAADYWLSEAGAFWVWAPMLQALAGTARALAAPRLLTDCSRCRLYAQIDVHGGVRLATAAARARGA